MAMAISRLATIIPMISSRTGVRSGSSQFVIQVV